MRIGDSHIGPTHPPYIIAELGVNHDGCLERALELTRAAAAAGADAVKLQLFETDRLMGKAAKLAAYQKAAGETDPIAMLKRLELGIDDMARVVTLAHELGIHAIVTVFSVELVELAERLPWDAYKTASPDIVHKPLLEALAATGKPLIVSTGASTIEEVQQAVNWLTAHPPTRATEPRPLGSGRESPSAQGRPSGSDSHLPTRDRLALMQCVSCYPTPFEFASFGGVRALQHLHAGQVGYSDHTESKRNSSWAILAGASLLEKHITHDRRAHGPDHAASLMPHEFRIYVETAHEQASMSARSSSGYPRRAVSIADPTGGRLTKALEIVGPVTKQVLPIEQDVRTLSRQSLTTRRALPRGHTLTRDDLTFKRPGTGLLPFQLDETLGRTLARDVEADVPLTAEDLA